MDELELPEGATYAGRSPTGHRTWKGQAESSADEKTSKFILYSGREVRYNPTWQEGGDIIRTREFRLSNYRLSNVVLADHNMNHVVGAGTASIVDAGDDGFQLHGTSTWDLHESNPLAILIAGQHARGIRKAVSIGFMPGKGSGPRTKLAVDDPYYLDPEKVPSWRAGWVHRHPELYEWSSVSVPKDPGALQLQSWAAEAESEDERVRRIVSEVLTQRAGELVLSAYRASAELRTAITAACLAALPAPEAPTDPKTQKADDADDWWENWT